MTYQELVEEHLQPFDMVSRDQHLALRLSRGIDMTEFEQAIKGVINKYSEENPSNTPDFILAMYLSNCLAAWNQATQQRETWYGRDATPIEITKK